MSTPQFGRPEPGREYVDRQAAFGLVDRDSRIALVRVEKPDMKPWYDLPGGALEAGETHEQAVVREMGEEVGLVCEIEERFAEAKQFFINDRGEAFNNHCVFFQLRFKSENAALKTDHDHTLVWMPPQPALAELRHEAHAWALHNLLRRMLST